MTGSRAVSRRDIDGALRGSGWRGTGGGAYCLDVPGRVLIHELKATRSWSRFRSSPFNLGSNGSGEPVFWDPAFAPTGPFKLTPAAQPGRVQLVADLPRKLPVIQGAPDPDPVGPPPDPSGRSWLDAWVKGLTATLRGLGGDGSVHASGSVPPPEPTALAGRIQGGCQVVLVRGDHVQVNFEEAGRHERVRIGPGPGDGIGLQLTLAETSGWSRASMRVAAAVAADANRGLKMVRVVHRQGNARPRLGLEIDLGGIPPDAPWLNLALDVLRGAAGLVAREIRALADPALARWVIRYSMLEPRENLYGDERR